MMTIKIGAFGDLHEGRYLDQILQVFNDEKVDIILANGDFIKKDNSKLYKILEYLISNSNSLVSVIPGNHEEKETWYQTLNKLQGEYNNFIYSKKFYFMNYQFIVVPGGTVKPDYINQIKHLDKSTLRYVDENTIVQMHEPPKYYGDLVCYNIVNGHRKRTTCNAAQYKENEGHIEITKLIESKLPKLVVAGHIHKQKAQAIPERVETAVSNHLFVNHGPAKDGYYTIIEIEEEVTAYLKKIEDRFHKEYYKIFSNL